MADIPKPVRHTGIITTDPAVRVIIFETLPDIAEMVRRAGVGRLVEDVTSGHYELMVSPRYDFDEVRGYIEALGSDEQAAA